MNVRTNVLFLLRRLGPSEEKRRTASIARFTFFYDPAHQFDDAIYRVRLKK